MGSAKKRSSFSEHVLAAVSRVAKPGAICYNCLAASEIPSAKVRPRSSVVEHFFGKEEVKGPIPFVGLNSFSAASATFSFERFRRFRHFREPPTCEEA